MIYLNNAATSYPKPQCVCDAHAAALLTLPEGQFRNSIKRQGDSVEQDVQTRCRQKLGKLFGISRWERVFFTSGATESLNTLLNGLGCSASQILTTVTEHNSVLRPLYNLPNVVKSAEEPILVPCDSFGRVDPKKLESLISSKTKLIILNHCSNVTGFVQDAKEIGNIAKRNHLMFLLDASQSAGCIPIFADEWNVNALVFTGHKGLLGVQGTGGFYISPNTNLKPLKFGGTGKDSSILSYNGLENSYEFEVGTQNIPGIAALEAGISYILEQGLSKIQQTEYTLINLLYKELEEMPNIVVYGKKNYNTGPVVSFNIIGLDPADTAYILQNGYGIVTRTGLHCAPLIHKQLGTFPKGTVRVSVSGQSTKDDIEQLLIAIKQISDSL